MIDESVYYKHYQLALNKKVEGLPCIDTQHDNLHPFFDFEEEKVFFECLSCDYKIYPGLNMYHKMRLETENIPNE
jgi:hypothetical protein